jgi:hypothetical protein
MEIKSLQYKNEAVDAQGNIYFDLSQASFDFKDNDPGTITYLSERYNSRPDLLALDFLDDPTYLDSVLKVNGIFNPFSVGQGEILFVPISPRDNESAYYSFPTVYKPLEITGTASSTGNNQDQSTIDPSRLARLSEIASKQPTGVTTPLPPNQLQPGENVKTELSSGYLAMGTNLPTRLVNS